jgi:hypothetical protein
MGEEWRTIAHLSSKKEDGQDEHAREESLDEDALSEVDAGSEGSLGLEIAGDECFDQGGSYMPA